MALNEIAPDYYPGVFPNAHRGTAADVGVTSGVFQGFALGLFVGVILVLGLAWLKQLRVETCQRGVPILLACTVVFSVGGGLLGWALGEFRPDYYRQVLWGGGQPGFNPIDVGIGLGASQGAMLGSIVGGLGVIGSAWRRSRAEKLASLAQPDPVW